MNTQFQNLEKYISVTVRFPRFALAMAGLYLVLFRFVYTPGYVKLLPAAEMYQGHYPQQRGVADVTRKDTEE